MYIYYIYIYITYIYILCIYIYIYHMYIITLRAFLFVNVTKYQLNDETFKIKLYFDSYISSTD